MIRVVEALTSSLLARPAPPLRTRRVTEVRIKRLENKIYVLIDSQYSTQGGVSFEPL
jgi:hypothetical protein